MKDKNFLMSRLIFMIQNYDIFLLSGLFLIS